MLLLCLLLIAMLGVILSMMAAYIEELVRPSRSSICCTTPADLGFVYEQASFTSRDGVRIAGWYIPSQNRAAVILLHGYGANRVSMLQHAELLARQGYGVLLYDQRASGESEGPLRTYGWLDVIDVEAALAYLQARSDVDPARIGIVGSSTGGQIALRATAQLPGISAVFADGPSIATVRDAPPSSDLKDQLYEYPLMRITDLGIELRTGVKAPPAVVDVIGSIAPRPLMLVAAGQGMLELYKLRYYYQAAHEPKTLWEIPEAYHTGGLSARPQEYAEKMIGFFNQALLR